MKHLLVIVMVYLTVQSALAQSINITGNVKATGNVGFTLGTAPPPTTFPSNSTCGTTGGGFDGPAALPLTYLCSSEADTPRSTPTTISLAPGTNLQTAYNGAPCGASIELTAGASYSIATIAGKGCAANNWIYIRTAPSANLPVEGQTSSPCYANITTLADYPNFGCTGVGGHGAYLATITVPAAGTINGTGMDHIRFENVVIQQTAGAETGALITAVTASNVVFDRIVMLGVPGSEVCSGVIADGGSNISLVDSWTSDIHGISSIGACTEGHIWTVATAPGPFKLSHNYLSASSQQMEWGGGGFTYGTPSDIEISYNHGYRPFTWDPACLGGICPGGVNYNGGVSGGHAYNVKNQIEFKNAQRVLIFGNTWENVWAQGQAGNAITITPKSQASGSSNLCPQCVTINITERYDQIIYSAQAWQIANVANGNGAFATAGYNYSIHDVLAWHTQYTGQNASFGFMGELAGTATLPLSNVTFNHVTLAQDNFTNTSLFAIGGPVTKNGSLVMQNSILPSGNFGMGNFGGGGCDPITASTPGLLGCFSPMTFTQNGIPYASGTSCSGHGCGGTWSATTGSLFLLADQNAVQYTNMAAGNYLLLGTSPLHNQGTDGKDLGADITTLNSYISLVP